MLTVLKFSLIPFAFPMESIFLILTYIFVPDNIVIPDSRQAKMAQ